MSDLARAGAALAMGLLASAVLLEVGLRLVRPLELTVRGDAIVLTTDTEWRFTAPPGSMLDPEIIHRRNDIGFRGEDYHPAGRRIRVFFVGGSTTAQAKITEGKTWSDLLRGRLEPHFPDLWLNNAGFPGHSTFAHALLLREHLPRYQPDLIVFLVGINDVSRDDLERRTDLRFWGYPRGLLRTLAGHSETGALLVNLHRFLNARTRGLTDDVSGVDESWILTWEVDEETKRAHLEEAERHLDAYRERLERLVAAARAMGSGVVLVTQPALYGAGIDDRTGLDLSRIDVNGVDGATAWLILERYNDVTRSVAGGLDATIIDLARALPKSSYLYYDTIHFTNEGAVEVARLLYPALCAELATLFPHALAAACPEGAAQ